MTGQYIFESKSDCVYKLLKQKILKDVLKQGEKININRVAEELGISSIPVREAINRLEMEGLVYIIPHKGAHVSVFDDRKVREVISIRAVLEGYATRTAIPYIDNALMLELKCMSDEMERHANKNDDASFGIVNKDFHRKLYKQSPFPLLYDMIFKLWEGGNWSKSVFAFRPDRMLESVEEHRQILKAIEEKDGDKVENLVRKHKEKNMKLLLEIAKHDF